MSSARALVLGLWVALASTLVACEDEAPLLGDAAVTTARDGGAGGDASLASGDASLASGDAAEAGATSSAVIDCFKGTPKTHDELLNACWSDTVVGVSKNALLPGGYSAGTPLPPPP